MIHHCLVDDLDLIRCVVVTSVQALSQCVLPIMHYIRFNTEKRVRQLALRLCEIHDITRYPVTFTAIRVDFIR